MDAGPAEAGRRPATGRATRGVGEGGPAVDAHEPLAPPLGGIPATGVPVHGPAEDARHPVRAQRRPCMTPSALEKEPQRLRPGCSRRGAHVS